MFEKASRLFASKNLSNVIVVLTRYRPRPKIRKEHHLLTSKNETIAEEEEEDNVRICSSVTPLLILFQDSWSYYALLASCRFCVLSFIMPSNSIQNLTLALISDSPTLDLQKLAPVAVPRKQSLSPHYYQEKLRYI